jgi:hypothetical protein
VKGERTRDGGNSRREARGARVRGSARRREAERAGTMPRGEQARACLGERDEATHTARDREGEDHVWFEDRWMVASWSDE